MPRRRSLDPAERISFSMKRSLIMRLDHHLSFNSSRSAWITNAIEAKLRQAEEQPSIIEATPTKDLLLELILRQEGQFSKVQMSILNEMLVQSRDLP